MFILGVRDPTGSSIAAILVLMWLVTTILISYVPSLISVLLVAFSVLATLYGAYIFQKLRNTLKFSNLFAAQLAFPSDGRVNRLVLNLNLSIFLLCFVPSASILSIKPMGINDPEARVLMSAVFAFGYLGVLGLCLQYLLRKKG